MAQVQALVSKSEQLFQRAQKVIPGGVNSPVRACKAVGGNPIFFGSADGAYLFDVDENSYIDYVGSWGPMILGHRHPRVLEAIEQALVRGTSFGAPSIAEIDLAELVCKMVPSIEMVRMVCSGTEATMSAVRLARAHTKKDIIIKFDGCYHGHFDSFLVKAGSGLATLGIASSPGAPDELTKLTISLPYNNIEAVRKAFAEHKDKIAAVIIEPIVGNAGLILPKPGFLDGIREICSKEQALLIFDEVMTGFRVAAGGAQALYGIVPDLTCLGKIIGGGLPVGAYGGKREIMEMVAPSGPVYQAGTLSGNPLAMAAGLAQLKVLQTPGTYEHLAALTTRLADGISKAISNRKMKAQVVSTTGMICLFFTDKTIEDFASAQTADTAKFAKFWQSMKKRGIYLPPSQFESAFISLVHHGQDIDKTISAVEESLAELT